MKVLKNKFSTSIKLRRIKYYKIYGTLKKRQVEYSLVLTPSAIPQPTAIRPPKIQIPTLIIP